MDTIRAKYDGSELLVVERSAGLPESPANSSFMDYLAFLSITGWKAARASFVKEELKLHVERMTEIPYPTIPLYLIQTLHQTPTRRGVLTTFPELNTLASGLQEAAIRQGWQVLATSKPLLRRGGFTVILSLWMKDNPPDAFPPTISFLGAKIE